MRRDVTAVPHLPDGADVGVTVSVGLAVRRADGSRPAALLATADQALSPAGATGRDRVVAAIPRHGRDVAGISVPELVPGA